MFRKIILAISLGIIFTIWHLPHDPFFQQLVAHQFTIFFNKAFDCQLSFKQIQIDLWAPELVFENICVVPKERSGWQWKATTYRTRCSWWHLLKYRSLDLDMYLEGFKAESEYKNGQLLIQPHIEKIVLGKPLIPVVIKNLQLDKALFTILNHEQVYAQLDWSAVATDVNGVLHLHFSLVNGFIKGAGLEIAQPVITLKGEFSPNANSGCSAHGTCTILNKSGNPFNCDITASLRENNGNFAITAKEYGCLEGVINLQEKSTQITACISLDNLIKFNMQPNPLVSGQILVSATVCWDTQFNARLHAKTQKLSYATQLLSDDIVLDARYDKQVFKGDISYQQKSYISLKIDKSFCACQLEIKNELANLFSPQVSAKGDILIELAYKNNALIGQINTQDVFMRIPNTYYCIDDVQGRFIVDLPEKKITVSDLKVAIDTGIISTRSGIISFEDGNLGHLYLPLVLKKVPLKMHPEITAYCSGAITVKKDQKLSLSGSVFIDEGCIENIVALQEVLQPSDTVAQTIDADIDLQLQTRAPVILKIPFTKGGMSAQIAVKNTIKNPVISGKLEIKNGILQLPYKPLYLETAQLLIMPNSAPMVNIVGTTTVKKYDIVAQLLGSLSDLQLLLTSNPVLPETQIVSLLLGGNAQSGLATLIPSVSTNIGLDYINQTIPEIKFTAQKWHMPFKQVRLVPHFDDQSARGGVRAAIEIDVTDQLTALIQKNFSLTEDTRLELAYSISDDIAVRTTRDERRDLNAEIEMRWKF